MYLHNEDRELLKDIILTASERSGIAESIVEKDYYVTLLLKELSARYPNIVFKGGTSLSKAYHLINRFSEDVDVTFTEHIGEARRKKLKYGLMREVSAALDMPIANWDEIESDKNYNHYDFRYEPAAWPGNDFLKPYIKLETALMSYAFPTEDREIRSIIYDFLKDTDPDILAEYALEPFVMKTQTPERTFADKLFAVCDYYLLGKPGRNSRHLYDVYMLGRQIVLDDTLRELMCRVREHRVGIGRQTAPSAQQDVDIKKTAAEICRSGFYRKDYETVTEKLIQGDVSYDSAISFFADTIRELF